MIRRTMLALVGALALTTAAATAEAQQPQAYGRQWGQSYNTQDWSRFLHYPYVWYPQNFWGPDYYKSARACTTVIRPRCAFRSTTSAGTTSTPNRAVTTRGTTSFWIRSKKVMSVK